MNNFQEKELSHGCSTLAFIGVSVAAGATAYQEPHYFWTRLRTKGQDISVKKKFMFGSNLMPKN